MLWLCPQFCLGDLHAGPKTLPCRELHPAPQSCTPWTPIPPIPPAPGFPPCSVTSTGGFDTPIPLKSHLHPSSASDPPMMWGRGAPSPASLRASFPLPTFQEVPPPCWAVCGPSQAPHPPQNSPKPSQGFSQRGQQSCSIPPCPPRCAPAFTPFHSAPRSPLLTPKSEPTGHKKKPQKNLRVIFAARLPGRRRAALAPLL